jgi:hypothetical protein
MVNTELMSSTWLRSDVSRVTTIRIAHNALSLSRMRHTKRVWSVLRILSH